MENEQDTHITAPPESLEAVRIAYADAHETSLSILDEHHWSILTSRWHRGIDWNIGKAVSTGRRRWQILGAEFSGFPFFRTKAAAYDAAESLILAESRWRWAKRLGVA